MPFVGVPIITPVNDRTCRITGVSLALSGAGTLGFSGSGADIEFPPSFLASSYTYQGGTVDLSQGLEVNINPGLAVGAFTNLQPSVQFSGGLTGLNPLTLRITVTNTNSTENTQPLSILISYLGGGKVSQPSRIAP
jgi:hypothetical protein